MLDYTPLEDEERGRRGEGWKGAGRGGEIWFVKAREKRKQGALM